MDPRLETALQFAHYRQTVAKQRLNLRMRLENMLSYSENGGTFNIDRDLISFVDLLIRRELKEAVLLDARQNPVLIRNLETFQDKVLSLYIEATNEYLVENDKLKKARSITQATGVEK